MTNQTNCEDEVSLPPLLHGHPLDIGMCPVHRAKSGARSGDYQAGDLLWSRIEDNLRFCLVLEPDVSRDRCGEVLYLAMLAIADSIGALGSPEVAVTFQWPNDLMLNGAQFAHVDLHFPDPNDQSNDAPDWMVLAVKVAIRDTTPDAEGGYHLGQTTLWDEGCGEIERGPLLESITRHLQNQIYQWESDGFKVAHQQWLGRLDEASPINALLKCDQITAIDENGNALVRRGETQCFLNTLESLVLVRGARKKALANHDEGASVAHRDGRRP